MVGRFAVVFQVIPKNVGGSVSDGVDGGAGGCGKAGAITLTAAEADLVGSALLLAVTVAVPGLEGAL